MKGSWIRLKYISEQTGREVGHMGHHTGKRSVKDLFMREYIDPGKVTLIELDGKAIEPTRENVLKFLK